ncbi:hypothetical protein [Demequina sp. NBRC 110054]|uniref:hypothetical protein n=1 Tax=Demequina sp. NBRC 110054 TaxID=1570343 RepID=UPI000A021EB0|nr:hypothetical protein [Demequina sp. NBRC 110054]
MDQAVAAIAFVVLGLGLIVAAVLEHSVGGAPAAHEVDGWVAPRRTRIAWIDELLVILSVVAIVGVVAAWRTMSPVGLGTALAAVLTVVAAAVAIATSALHGRLVYRIGSLDGAGDAARITLIVSAFYSALHVVALLEAVALVCLGLDARDLLGPPFAIASFLAAAVCVALSYAYLMPTWVGLALMAGVAGWCGWFAAELAGWPPGV